MFYTLVQIAQDLGTIKSPGGNLIRGDANASVTNTISIFVTTATIIAGLIFFVMLVIGGLQWLISGGDKAALDQARSRITNGLVGLVIVVAAIAITFVVQTALGIDILNPSFGP